MSTPTPPLPSPPRRRRERLAPYLLVMAASVAVIGTSVWPEFRRAQAIVGREEVAREALLQVRTLELALHQRQGRYGFVRDLASAGLLGGLEAVEADGATWVRAGGYRVEVLLPHARLGPGVVGITPDGSGTAVDPELAAAHFAVVARPLEPGVAGYRTWYVDERGELYLNEGVIDDESAARNDLPTTQVLENVSLDTASFLLWQKASEVPPPED